MNRSYIRSETQKKFPLLDFICELHKKDDKNYPNLLEFIATKAQKILFGAMFLLQFRPMFLSTHYRKWY